MIEATSRPGASPRSPESFDNDEHGAGPNTGPLTEGSAQFRKGAFELLRDKLKTGKETPDRPDPSALRQGHRRRPPRTQPRRQPRLQGAGAKAGPVASQPEPGSLLNWVNPDYITTHGVQALCQHGVQVPQRPQRKSRRPHEPLRRRLKKGISTFFSTVSAPQMAESLAGSAKRPLYAAPLPARRASDMVLIPFSFQGEPHVQTIHRRGHHHCHVRHPDAHHPLGRPSRQPPAVAASVPASKAPPTNAACSHRPPPPHVRGPHPLSSLDDLPPNRRKPRELPETCPS